MQGAARQVAQAAGVLGPAMDSSGGPLGVVGRVAGLGGEEIEAGVPGWAWFGIGLVVGATAMYALRPKIQAFIER